MGSNIHTSYWLVYISIAIFTATGVTAFFVGLIRSLTVKQFWFQKEELKKLACKVIQTCKKPILVLLITYFSYGIFLVFSSFIHYKNSDLIQFILQKITGTILTVSLFVLTIRLVDFLINELSHYAEIRKNKIGMVIF